MATRKRTVSIMRDPLFRGDVGLPFEESTNDSLFALTDEQKSEEFLSRWLRSVHPFTKYTSFFEKNEKSTDRILRDVKLWYRKLVVNSGWRELKYVYILDHMFLNGMLPLRENFESCEKVYNVGRLAAQVSERKIRRRARI